jgi:hypothetical protein
VKLGQEVEQLLDAEDGRTIGEMIAADSHTECIVTKVRREGETTTVEFDNGLSTFLRGPKVKVGDTVWLYDGGNGGWGSERHGWALNGEIVEWRTPLERVAERLRWLADHDRRKREEFVEERMKLDADFAALPTVLKERIERFRVENPDFRIKSERYELFCCTEAAKFAQAARSDRRMGKKDADAFWRGTKLRREAGGTVWDERPDSVAARWLLWAWALNTKAYDYDYKWQRKVLGCSDGHSGNTFGGAMHLAISLVEGHAT